MPASHRVAATTTTAILWQWLFLVLLVGSIVTPTTDACTNILVTPGASADGSSIVSYNADAPTLYGVLYHYPATTTTSKNQNATRRVYDWDTGRYLGVIPEALETYNVVGNSNEHGLIIGETTFGGVAPLTSQTGAIMDYGSLIYVTLQRARTVHEAMDTMVALMDEYGYASEGESFSLADRSGAVWMMEVIGRGNDYYGKLGAVWVAQKIPDGAVASHANQARITSFTPNDPETFRCADDVVEVAIHYGLYPDDAPREKFSFADVYDPVDFIGARQGEARVWSVLSQIADSTGDFERKYLSYALGKDITNRMPLYVTPYKKVSLNDVMQLMASHYEGTHLDSSNDVGAGLFESPYRPRPLQWSLNDTVYHNERSVATPKTGWNFVGQIRPWMPRELSSLLWFACDDSSTSPRVPVYSASTMISEAYEGQGPQDGVPSPLLKLDMKKAFWVQNMVSNFAYYRWMDVYPILRKKIDEIQLALLRKVSIIDQRALKAYTNEGVGKAIADVTAFSANTGDLVHQRWLNFYGELFVQFRDFYSIVSEPDDPLCGCAAKEPGLSATMKQRIVSETGDHYKVTKDPSDGIRTTQVDSRRPF